MYIDIDLEQKVKIPIAKMVGEAIVILGMRGSGKSNTNAVIIEELIARIPLTIIDPEGEYWGLREKYDIIVAGSSANVDIAVMPEQASALAEFSYRNGVSIILDLIDFSQEQVEKFVHEYLLTLWQLASKMRKPYFVVIDEAHEFAPQGRNSDTKELISKYAKRGRKRGLGFVVVSQRSQSVDKDLLTQMGTYFLHRVSHVADMNLYKRLVPGMKGGEVETAVRGLQPGQAIFIYNEQVEIISVRQRHTFHAGATPTLDAEENVPEFVRVDSALLEELKKVIEAVETKKAKPETAEQMDMFAALQQENETLRAENQALREQLQMLSHVPAAAAPVQQMQVGTITANEIRAVNGHAMPDEVPQGWRSPIQEKREIYRQRRNFDDLLLRLKKVPKWHLRALVLLMNNPNKEYNIRALSWALTISTDTIYRNAPHKLIEEGLIKRDGSGVDGITYKSAVEALITKEFPALNRDELLTELSQLA